MTVIFTRVGTPVPGRLGEAAAFMRKRADAIKSAYGVDVSMNARFGGPVGQMALVSYHENMGELEEIRRKIIADVGAGKLPTPEPGTFHRSDDAIWLKI